MIIKNRRIFDMIANLFDRNLMKILALFLISPGSRYIRKEIKEKTQINNVPLDKTLSKLLALKIIKQEKNLLILNQEYEFKNILEKIRKEFVELNLPLKVYSILLEVTDKFSGLSSIKNIYLFGSYAKFIYHEDSDIDIAIIFSNKLKNKNELEEKINRDTEKISKKHKKKIEIHFFLEKDTKEKDPLIKDILRNGKRIL